MRPHPLHVKVTLILSRNYFSLIFSFLSTFLFFPVIADHTGDLIFAYLPQLNIVTVQGKLSGLKAQQRYRNKKKKEF
jgi:hypothetical protein